MVSENGSQEMVGGGGDALKMFLGGLVLGGLIGGTFALLYAPMKGEDTRRMLKEKAGDAGKMIEAKSMEMKDRAGEVMADVKSRAMDARKRGENVLDCIKQA